jgi:hypothetical protein
MPSSELSLSAQTWLPNPPAGTAICLGFDGSLNNDWTALQAETLEGYSFTPRWGPDEQPTYWDPAENGGRIPHGDVATAVDELFDRYRVVRGYFDPHDWETDIEDYALKHGQDRVVAWATNRISQMHDELARFLNDLVLGRITHDGDPIAGTHMLQAKKVGRPGQHYILAKPNENQKIDIAMAKVLAHTAVRDVITGGLDVAPAPTQVLIFR